jgi:hypothetical protein
MNMVLGNVPAAGAFFNSLNVTGCRYRWENVLEAFRHRVTIRQFRPHYRGQLVLRIPKRTVALNLYIQTKLENLFESVPSR